MIVQINGVNEEAIEIDTLRVMSFVVHDFPDRQEFVNHPALSH